MNFGTSLLHGIEAFGRGALKVGEVAAPIAAQMFVPQFAGAVQGLVAQAEQKFPVSVMMQTGTDNATVMQSVPAGKQKFDWVKTSIEAAIPFLTMFAGQHGLNITASSADIDAAIEAALVAFKADIAAEQAIHKLFEQPTAAAAAAA